MKQEELLKLLNSKTDESFKFDSISSINHKPHPYMITQRHVKYCEGGMLDKYSIRNMEKNHNVKCGQKDCNLTFAQHTCNTVIFVKCFKEDWNQDIFKQTAEENETEISKLAEGFVFVRSWNELLEDSETTS